MGGTAAIVLIIATLCVDGNAGAGLGADGAPDSDGAASPAQAKRVRRRRAPTRRRTATNSRTTTGQPRPDPSGQPAHMAPQLEDIPPTKPPAKVPPKPDKSNPS